MIYAVNYDLRAPGRNYVSLYEAIKRCGDWWHYLGSTWLIDSRFEADAICRQLTPHIDQNDALLVIGITDEFGGWLPKGAWQWIQARMATASIEWK